MKFIVLSTSSEKSKGVTGKDSLDPEEAYVFTDIYPYTSFHMRSVPFPIDIAFLDQDCGILSIKTMEAEEGNAQAPSGTAYAVEASKDFFKGKDLKVDDVWKEFYNYIKEKS